MAIYYIENPNGKYPSEDGSRRFDMLSGRKAYAFLKSEAGKGRRFIQVTDGENSDPKVYVEVSKKDIPTARKAERHEQYTKDSESNSNTLTVSLSEVIAKDESGNDIYRAETLVDEGSDLEILFEHQYDLDSLRSAIMSLEESEFSLIQALYLQENPISTREYAREKGIPQRTLNDQKKRVLKKIKSFL